MLQSLLHGLAALTARNSNWCCVTHTKHGEVGEDIGGIQATPEKLRDRPILFLITADRRISSYRQTSIHRVSDLGFLPSIGKIWVRTTGVVAEHLVSTLGGSGADGDDSGQLQKTYLTLVERYRDWSR